MCGLSLNMYMLESWGSHTLVAEVLPRSLEVLKVCLQARQCVVGSVAAIRSFDGW